jgi:hypothetical protein
VNKRTNGPSLRGHPHITIITIIIINKRLCAEIQRIWNMKCMITLVTTGATVTVTKGLKKNFGAVQEGQ